VEEIAEVLADVMVCDTGHVVYLVGVDRDSRS
jgi:hypothetical protein